ncbi:ethanolamine ammonia-lyase reactivating factor EutA [Paenibacillus sp. GCM10027628]|uniref:ethanolamine ammonia-lyase reactivating factor EutA n=1 Tax=Paenibacillus sp. GCM10027628 TaxID=3273413 RepID=UPI003642BC44
MKQHQQAETIISAGIDIGTSTTKLILSRFSLMNTAGTSHVPRIEIIDKQVFYKSPIYRTPLRSNVLIDLEAVQNLVKKEYAKAGVRPQDIKTGAVIITGETATKHNAEEMIHSLSSEAGEFLVATAGPDLEGIIAAKGSGAYQYSKQSGKTIANIDIGGGTANLAVYQSGNFKGTCTLHIGGRLIELDKKRIKTISPPIQNLLSHLGHSLSPGDPIHMDDIHSVIKEVIYAMVRTLVHILEGKVDNIDKVLLLGHPPDWGIPIDEIMFSGGVSECMYGLETNSEQAQSVEYEDIGFILAESLRQSAPLKRWKWITPIETVRATVLGAGTQTTEISGATIQVESSRLPIKNLPVYHVQLSEDLDNGKQIIHQAIEQALQIYDPLREGINFALYMTGLSVLRFREVQQLAGWLLESYQAQPNQLEPLIVIMANDMAKVLGQTLQAMNPGRDIICIDQVLVEHGDYLDIGKKLQTEVVPVVVKTLAFHS